MNARTSLLIAAGCILAGFALASSAHHAATMFDRERTVELYGEIVEFQWTSPHVWIQINVENESGEVVEWSVEGSVPNRLYRAGWRPTTFKPATESQFAALPCATEPLPHCSSAPGWPTARHSADSTNPPQTEFRTAAAAVPAPGTCYWTDTP